MDTKTGKMNTPTFMIGEIANALFIESTLPKEQRTEFYMHPLDTVEVVFKLE